MENGKRDGFGHIVKIIGADFDLSYIGNFSKNKYSGSGIKLGKSLFDGYWHLGKPAGLG